jgi:SM-20-related protein
MPHLDIELLKHTELKTQPYEYVVVRNFLKPESLKQVVENFPDLKGGSYPLKVVNMPKVLQEVIDELDGPVFEKAIADKFDLELAGMPKMYSLRGYCRANDDGHIHTDSKDKIITVLLYMNERWQHEHGRLRLLHNSKDLDAYAEEVPPDDGTLLVFKRSEKSWHGHGPFEGVRRSIQMNWMVSAGRRDFHSWRHKLSSKFKELTRGEQRSAG